MSKNTKRLIPFVILVILILLVYVTNLHQEFTLDRMRHEHQRLTEFVQAHPTLSPLIFIGFYVASVCLVIPDSTILTLIGGLLFPFPLAIICTVFAETLGATIFFAIFQGVFGTSLIQRERPFLNKMRKQFKRHTVSYLLFLRLSHVFPFWLTNVCSAYFKVRYWTFIWTCLLGVLPLAYILTKAGQSLSDIFANGQPLALSDVFTPQMKFALIIIGLLALAPIVYKHFFKRNKWKW